MNCRCMQQLEWIARTSCLVKKSQSQLVTYDMIHLHNILKITKLKVGDYITEQAQGLEGL